MKYFTKTSAIGGAMSKIVGALSKAGKAGKAAKAAKGKGPLTKGSKMVGKAEAHVKTMAGRAQRKPKTMAAKKKSYVPKHERRSLGKFNLGEIKSK